MAGGAYSGLLESLGGPRLAAIGWAAGLERIVLARSAVRNPGHESGSEVHVDMCVCPLRVDGSGSGEQDVAVSAYALQVADRLRAAGVSAITEQPQHPSAALRRVAKLKARYALLVGAGEMQSQTVCAVRLQKCDKDDQRQSVVAVNSLQVWAASKRTGQES